MLSESSYALDDARAGWDEASAFFDELPAEAHWELKRSGAP